MQRELAIRFPGQEGPKERRAQLTPQPTHVLEFQPKLESLNSMLGRYKAWSAWSPFPALVPDCTGRFFAWLCIAGTQRES